MQKRVIVFAWHQDVQLKFGVDISLIDFVLSSQQNYDGETEERTDKLTSGYMLSPWRT